MSRTVAGRFTAAATLAHPVDRPVPAPAGDTDPSVQVETRQRERPDNKIIADLTAAPTRVGPSRNTHSRLSDDPSNYLG